MLGRRAVVGAVLVMLGVGALAEPAPARAGGLIADSPRIGTIRALIPRQGRDAGRLIVWVRVDHAAGTRRALNRKRPETVHEGRVVVRVGGVARFATRRLSLDRRLVPAGYFHRFSSAVTRATVAAAGRRVAVSARASQTLDLDSDGRSDDRSVRSTRRSVTLARPAISIEPLDGDYLNSVQDTITVAGGYVTHYGFLSGTGSPCAAGPADSVIAPIDPQTGLFSFTDTPSFAPITTTVQGDFQNTTTLVVDATVSFNGCTYRVPSNFQG
jgi:hypothetical protein